MKRTFSTTHVAFSALAVALLTACGGGDGSNFVGGDGTNTFNGSGQTIDPVNTIPSSVDKFLVNMSSEGKQTKNIVVSVDNNHNQTIDYGDAVRFNQPGVISCMIGGTSSDSSSSGGSTCGSRIIEDTLDPLKTAVTRATEAKATAQAKVEAAQKALEEAQNAGTSTVDALTALSNAEAQLQAASEALTNAENALAAAERNASAVSMLDVNGNRHAIMYTNTIDSNTSAYSQFLSHDVGVRKIMAERKIENGEAKLYNYGGSIDRQYNGIVLFAQGATNNGQYLDIYLRDPAAAGLSYNTFGAFSSAAMTSTRDVNIGYQSIGKAVTDLPTTGTAKYKGIAHAYINDLAAANYSGNALSQVTMDVTVDANFASRSLGFNTNNTYIHTYETLNGVADQHIIQSRPDLNLSGSAGWNRGVGDFTGTVRNAGGNLSGSIEGSFYGPAAAEVGGVFGLSGQDALDPNSTTHRVHYVGGFGAKRD